ncbi:MAG: 2-oxo-4-hydroxy-4-carboxy-5-ureidoimidazoline decarboxylase, partial [Gemmatimonadaceae bacterium]
LDSAKAVDVLRACCGSSRWVERMIAARPFSSDRDTLDAADRIWNGLSSADWLEAFDHHPRIGENNAAVPQDAKGTAWSSLEQSRVTTAGADVKRQLAQVNEEYERRFGFIYIVCATGKSADELLATARTRLHNDPDTELRVAAEEQRKIMQLRLAKLLKRPEST